MESEKVSDQPPVMYKIKSDLSVGTPLAEIISGVDPNDKDRKEWNVQTSFYFQLSLLKGDLESGNYKVARTGENILMEAKDIQKDAAQEIKISILPADE